KKVEGVKFEPEAAVDADGDGNKDAGKLFASQGGNGGGAADAGNAANDDGSEDVGNVVEANGGSKADDASVKGIASGMKAIVEVAKKVEGVKFAPEAAVEAADNADNKDAGKLFASQNAQGAAADAAGKAADGEGSEVGNVVEANGSIADDASVKGIAGGMKTIVEVAEKVEGVKFEPEKAVDADGNGNKDAGKLFASRGGNGAAADAGNATNPIAAAIGTAEDNANQGFDRMKKKNDKIAAAIVLRGMAKGGKFALGNGGDFNTHKSGVKSTVENAVAATLTSLENLVKKAVGAQLQRVAAAVLLRLVGIKY
ncbi:variable large family protein, partial [Borreliella garinii]|uniref:variable large family protein n=1 Tax=Borreliella garinii TaxID=29519 RepID=UPI001AEF8D22